MYALHSIFRIVVLSATLLLAVGLGQPVLSQDDSLLVTYQGYLTDSDGDPITGNHSLTFTIYDSEGTALWTEEHSSVSITNGLFSVILGFEWPYDYDVTTSSLGDFGHVLGISVDGDDEMVPRAPLTSVFQAAVTKRVAGDILTAPGILQVHSPDDCVPPDPCQPAIEMVAEPDNHAIRVHPPEPCVPPEPCGPAIELMASAEIHSLKVLPPAPPAGGNPQPVVYVECGEMSGTVFCSGDGALQGLVAGLGVDAESNESYLELGSTSIDGSGATADFGVSADSGRSHLSLASTSTDGPGPTIEVFSETDHNGHGTHCAGITGALDDGSNTFFGMEVAVTESGSNTNHTFFHSADSFHGNSGVGVYSNESRVSCNWADVSGDSTAVAMASSAGLAKLTVFNGDPTESPDVVVQATTDGGGQIGINTDTPTEALDVNGTTQTTGFKMPTGAADGRVLTSDGDGNGTWQAASSGGSKAMCADMYEGLTNASSQVPITFPVTFTAAPHFSVTGIIKSGAQAGKMAYIPKPTPGISSVTVTIQYWTGVTFMDVGSSEEVMLSYTAIEK